jgi:xanthosine utilization system XapX-like protein
MHNCKTTREQLTELLLDGPDLPAPLPAELRECVECRQEFRALRQTLRLTTQLIETATPPNNYWPGYHARLREKLQAAQHPRIEPGRSKSQPWLVRFFVSSIRIPVPVGLALLVILGFLIFKSRVPPVEPSIVQVPVEVPVIQEKIVERERVVYRERPSLPAKHAVVPPSRNESVLANLEGFEPAEEVKLTVIKGASGNYEK